MLTLTAAERSSTAEARPGQDVWSKQVSRWTGVGAETSIDIPAEVRP
ncbi:hypothetical protein [Nocardia sp. NPDC047038]